MSDPSPVDTPRRRSARSGRAAITAAAIVLVIVAAPIVYFSLDDGSTIQHDDKTLVDTDSLAAVRAALGQTIAAGSYESDTVSTATTPAPASCAVLLGPGATVAARPTCPSSALPPITNRFETHTIVNFEPYAMMSQTQSSSLGAITTHVNSTTVWQLGGATVGYSSGNPGMPLPNYVGQVLGTLGPGPGAMAMLSLASRGGYLNLEEESIAAATPAGTGTVRDVEVTFYDVTIDLKKLADSPDLSDVQRATIAAAIPKLEQAGYTGTQERIGIDAQGYIRSVDATTSFADGSTWVRHSVLYNFGCAPKISMPNEPPAPTATMPCLPPSTTTTAPATTTSTAAPSTTTTAPTATTSTAPPATTSTTSPPTPTTKP